MPLWNIRWPFLFHALTLKHPRQLHDRWRRSFSEVQKATEGHPTGILCRGSGTCPAPCGEGRAEDRSNVRYAALRMGKRQGRRQEAIGFRGDRRSGLVDNDRRSKGTDRLPRVFDRAFGFLRLPLFSPPEPAAVCVGIRPGSCASHREQADRSPPARPLRHFLTWL